MRGQGGRVRRSGEGTTRPSSGRGKGSTPATAGAGTSNITALKRTSVKEGQSGKAVGGVRALLFRRRAMRATSTAYVLAVCKGRIRAFRMSHLTRAGRRTTTSTFVGRPTTST